MPARARSLTPVLLLGGGSGEASCGILYLAGYLRRHGVEAFVRLCDFDETDEEVARSIAALVGHVRPRVVGISLKWFHHVHRALVIARAVREADPAVRIVAGGNTASWFWRELSAEPCVDEVILGDGEAPLLSVCRGEPEGPNRVGRDASGTPRRAPFGYVQDESSREIHYSHFEDLFLSDLDRHGFSGWIAPGKGCGESCVYCGGRRAAQRLSFGRMEPFLRAEASVRRDHREIAPFTWQLRYDFPGGTAAYLERIWAKLELSRHSTTYFLWGAPPRALIDLLARTFARVYLVLDIGCFSQRQREELRSRSLLKPCPSDERLLQAVDDCGRHRNVELEVCGIAGLPFTSPEALAEERRLVERLLGRGCSVGYQRLQAQPGALVTEHPDRFGMQTDARTFEELVSWFSGPDRDSLPMVRFLDRTVEHAVERSCEELETMLHRERTPLEGATVLHAALAEQRAVKLGAWFGRHKVSARAANERVTVVRSPDGSGLACAPRLDPRLFTDPMLQQGAEAAAILGALSIFSTPTGLDAGVAQLSMNESLDQETAREVVDRLTAGHFLEP